ncbi:MarR family winged helix-turn-helix transcriptional regulator [Actinomycetospora sp. CA-084318]|uniref:MarR family winged helix-turn-helix transcriptional regulator n=1 Tax=Actinomycetospora sp. CA-084318 TaxID=3239892 RepID=UPI003D973E82
MNDAVDALMATTRLLVGVATRALEDLGMSLPQFRLLLVLDELGASPGTVAAHRLGTAASSVTRLGDQLEASGHLTRRRDPANRSVVVLEPTEAGRALVGTVLARRREALADLVGRLPDEQRHALTAALTALRDAAGPDLGVGPVELMTP